MSVVLQIYAIIVTLSLIIVLSFYLLHRREVTRLSQKLQTLLHSFTHAELTLDFPSSDITDLVNALEMASSKDYLQFVLEQLSELQEITYRAMMGEFIIYYRGKIVGGIYDDRLLVKPTKSAISYMPTVTYEIPYENAKEMLLVEEIDNKDFLTGLFNVMYDELPTPKPKKKK